MIPYKKYEMESAMIKLIRRCDDDALFWAYRLSQVSGGFQKIWTRLEIMSAEDIGMAYPWLRTYLRQQHQTFSSLSDETSQRRVLLNTVHFFTRQYKSRLTDNINYVYFKGEFLNLSKQEVEELKHKLIKHIHNQELNPSLEVAGKLYLAQQEVLLLEILTIPQDPENLAISLYFQEQYERRLKSYDSHEVLFMVNLVLYRVMDISKIKVKLKVEPLDIDAVYADNRKLKVPDCAYDYHCTIGRNKGRGYQHYYEEGAKLNQCFLDDPYEPIAKAMNIEKENAENVKVWNWLLSVFSLAPPSEKLRYPRRFYFDTQYQIFFSIVSQDHWMLNNLQDEIDPDPTNPRYTDKNVDLICNWIYRISGESILEIPQKGRNFLNKPMEDKETIIEGFLNKHNIILTQTKLWSAEWSIDLLDN